MQGMNPFQPGSVLVAYVCPSRCHTLRRDSSKDKHSNAETVGAPDERTRVASNAGSAIFEPPRVTCPRAHPSPSSAEAKSPPHLTAPPSCRCEKRSRDRPRPPRSRSVRELIDGRCSCHLPLMGKTRLWGLLCACVLVLSGPVWHQAPTLCEELQPLQLATQPTTMSSSSCCSVARASWPLAAHMHDGSCAAGLPPNCASWGPSGHTSKQRASRCRR